MKFVLTLVPILSWIFGATCSLHRSVPAEDLIQQSSASVYDLTIEDIDGGLIKMSDYKGKYILCVNVASHCGYTSQYEDLQTLYDRYQDKLVVIGFPCNQFFNQEPGENEEIKSFCKKNYGVTFPLTTKIDVKGSNQHPVYQWLTTQEVEGIKSHTVKWNFHKFLINPEGKLIGEFPSKVNPLHEDITTKINL